MPNPPSVHLLMMFRDGGEGVSLPGSQHLKWTLLLAVVGGREIKGGKKVSVLPAGLCLNILGGPERCMPGIPNCPSGLGAKKLTKNGRRIQRMCL